MKREIVAFRPIATSEARDAEVERGDVGAGGEREVHAVHVGEFDCGGAVVVIEGGLAGIAGDGGFYGCGTGVREGPGAGEGEREEGGEEGEEDWEAHFWCVVDCRL